MIYTPVLAAQRYLNQWGARPSVAEDGVWGPQTEAALSAFARMNVLPYERGVGYLVPTGALLMSNTMGVSDMLYARLTNPPRMPGESAEGSSGLFVVGAVVVGALLYWSSQGKRTGLRGIRARRRRGRR